MIDIIPHRLVYSRHCIFASKILEFPVLFSWPFHDSLNAEERRKEGDAVKKVMLLASKDMCDILQSALGNTYITLPCSDPAAASWLLQSRPDVLVLELSLPGASGMTFLKAQAENLPPGIIALTPLVNHSILTDLTVIGVSSVFLIPCRLPCLAEALVEQLR